MYGLQVATKLQLRTKGGELQLSDVQCLYTARLRAGFSDTLSCATIFEQPDSNLMLCVSSCRAAACLQLFGRCKSSVKTFQARVQIRDLVAPPSLNSRVPT